MNQANEVFTIRVLIDDGWIEPKYDHVHHGRCLSLFEQARLALLEAIGFPNDGLLSQGQALVITRVNVQYKRELRRGEVRVSCEAPRIEGRALIVTQRIFNERGKVAVEAEVESMFMDATSRRGMEPPTAFRDAFEGAGR